MSSTKLPPRHEISLDTPLRLSVAAALAFPDGSMTARACGEKREGRLVIERIAGKDYTTLANIERMRELCRVEAKVPDCGSENERPSAQWVILDHGREIRTGAGESDIGAAENALAQYLANKRRPQFGDGHPSHVLIADAWQSTAKITARPRGGRI